MQHTTYDAAHFPDSLFALQTHTDISTRVAAASASTMLPFFFLFVCASGHFFILLVSGRDVPNILEEKQRPHKGTHNKQRQEKRIDIARKKKQTPCMEEPNTFADSSNRKQNHSTQKSEREQTSDA